ncbi:MAG: circadian clock protein KaiC [Fibrobacteres bacterium]|nr:circadian clock protein KaiC [Fibrobacterota bacterium]
MPHPTFNMTPPDVQLEKALTGIEGLDEITSGGLPKGRPTLICGSAGCGKTMFAIEFLVRGILEHGEPGVFIAFEESPEDLAKNVASLGFNLKELEEQGKLIVEYIHIDKSDIAVAGDFDLEGLFLVLQSCVESIGAKRVSIDTLEALFSGFDNHALLRQEIRRLFRWLKDRDLTTVITAERGDGALTRQGLEEYVSDCVIVLDHRIIDQVSTRRLRVVKYRGSVHGTNEYPFLIDDGGISVLPISSLGLDHPASKERISTGVPRLDIMMEGKGYYRGSSVLVSGTAGSGKTSLANFFADATCRRGEKCLYMAFEESPSQIKRNMESLGLNQEQWTSKGLLTYYASRPSLHGLEMHLVKIHKMVKEIRPQVIVIDPITNLTSLATMSEVNAMLVRLIDFLKAEGITALFTSLTSGTQSILEATDVGVSSLIDTWLLVRDIESSGERNRGMYVIKSRGMAHSNQIREFRLSSEGIDLRDVYVGPSGMLTGSARLTMEAEERAAAVTAEQEIENTKIRLERKRQALEAQWAVMQAEFANEEEEAARFISQKKSVQGHLMEDRNEMARQRKSDDAEPLNVKPLNLHPPTLKPSAVNGRKGE